MKKNIIQIMCIAALSFSCGRNDEAADASGSFEAVETIISSEATGKILSLTISEGEALSAGQVIGAIDSTQLYLTRMQLLQNKKAILSGRPDTKAQIESLKKELANAIDDRNRIANLVKGGVASQKQLDDADAKVSILQSRITSQSSMLGTTTSSLNEQAGTAEIQLAQVEDQLRKCKVVNPVTGLVLTKYAEQSELTSIGKPLYKIADLSTMILRAYVSGNQLAQLKLNQKVAVSTDDGHGGLITTEGTVSWISNKAEFTPKTIQTKDERANLVYAIKVSVKNNGAYKIGMYGEVKF
ncbi:MAG TPA: HlyD family efflux transporter periplasmic adaptor subunit [Chryseolinea sp.]|nr:HlyD family efflux transporter periplasmic adaptor subunit [Chryseolinea sp.]